MNASLYVFAVENDQLTGLRAGQAKTFRVEQDGIAAVLLALLAAHRGRARLADASGAPTGAIRWIKASGLLGQPEVLRAARLLDLVDDHGRCVS
jgi:hypothetical protein